MERLAGRVMLAGGISRAVMAIAAGAVGALALPPFGFSRRCFCLSLCLSGSWMAAPENRAAASSAAFCRPSASAGVSGSVTSSRACGGSVMLSCWRPMNSPGRCRSPFLVFLLFWRCFTVLRLPQPISSGRRASAVSLHLLPRSAFRNGCAAHSHRLSWNAIGYGIMPIPIMMQSAHLLGLFSITTLAVFIFASPALIGTKRHLAGSRRGGAAAGRPFRLWLLPSPDAGGGARRRTDRSDRAAVHRSVTQDAERGQGGDFGEHLRLSALPPGEGKSALISSSGRKPPCRSF